MKKDYSDKNIISRPYLSAEESLQKKQRRILKRVLVFVFVVLLVTIGYVCGFTSVFKITHVQIEGEFDPQLKESIQPVLNTLYLGANIFFATARRSKRDIESIVPHLISISLDRHFPSTVTIRIKQRLPMLKILQPDGSIFLADSDSFVFTIGETGANAPIIIEIPTSTRVELDTTLFTKDQIDSISAYISQLDSELSIKIAKISQIGTLASQYNFYSQKRWYLMIDIRNSATSSIQTLKTFLSEKYREEPTLRYVDLRIPNSVFYNSINDDRK